MSPFMIILGLVALVAIIALLSTAARRNGPRVTTIETRRDTTDAKGE